MNPLRKFDNFNLSTVSYVYENLIDYTKSASLLLTSISPPQSIVLQSGGQPSTDLVTSTSQQHASDYYVTNVSLMRQKGSVVGGTGGVEGGGGGGNVGAAAAAAGVISNRSILEMIVNASTATVASMPSGTLWDWTELVLVCLLCLLIVITIIGNTLVILAVITTRRLRTVTNCFVMSLAVADWLVGIFVMPPAVAVLLAGTWKLGWILCDIWISLDVLMCTASILSLCAISIDRYLAVTQPLNYSRRRRSKRLALIMIFIVWVLALAITCPPILGWYEPGRRGQIDECRYNQNKGYVVFSALGSFFIPMVVMAYVYVKISCVVASRHDHLAEIEVHKSIDRAHDIELDQETSDNDHHHHVPSRRTTKNSRRSSLNNSADDHWTNHHIHHGNAAHNKHQHLTAPSNSATLQSNTNLSTDYAISKHMRVHQKSSVSNRTSVLKRENKTTQTLSIVMGGFIACWLPFFINYIITPFLPHDAVSPMLSNFLTWLGWFNSAINPFIYAFYSIDFRAAFWRLTLGKIFRHPHKAPFPSTTVSIRR